MNLRLTALSSACLAGAIMIGQLRAAGGSPGHVVSTLAALIPEAPAPGGEVGPDVIVSKMGGITRYGAVGGITGYAIDTTSCNKGGLPAIWIDFDFVNLEFVDQHPLIGQNLYRLENGRFEQIGMSWVKHAFCGVDEFDMARCGTCQPDFDCDWLAVGCSDTYTAGHNSAQVDLGPRSEVNGSNGVYPYPYGIDWQVTGNAIYKRLQVHNSDLDEVAHPDARFFIEAHYLTTDEAPSARENNASNRECFRGTEIGGSYELVYDALIDVVAQQNAIEAWEWADRTVTLVEQAIPGDGRVMVGYKVSDNGNGTWHYEYAVYNQNSDEAVAGFSVEMGGCNASITNAGFHDVDYHSGDPVSGVDWPVVIDSTVVSWTTDDFLTDPNANAIRWNTMYNFRFDADTPPVLGSATLTPFKTGGQPRAALPVMVPGEHTCPADIDDDFQVGITDFLLVLARWGTADADADFFADGGTCPDGVVGIADFLGVLMSWGPCP